MYCIFFAAYLGLAGTSTLIGHWITKRIASGKQIFWQIQLFAISSILFWFLFLRVLSNFFEWKYLIGTILLTEISIGLAYVLAGLWGLLKSIDFSPTYFFTREVLINSPWMGIVAPTLFFLSVAAYPVLIGIVYYSNGIPDIEKTNLYLQCTSFFLIIAGYAPMLLTTSGPLASAYVPHQHRSRLLILGVSVSPSIIVTFMLTYFTFDKTALTNRNLEFFTLSIPLYMEPVALSILIIAFMVALPYLIGIQKSKSFIDQLSAKKNELMSEIRLSLNSPAILTNPNLLQKLKQIFIHESARLYKSDRIIRMGLEIESGETPKEISRDSALYIKAFFEMKKTDPRFLYLEWLSNIRKNIEELEATLKKSWLTKKRKDICLDWLAYFELQKSENDRQLDQRNQSLTSTQSYSGVFFSLITALLISIAANWLWSIFAELI